MIKIDNTELSYDEAALLIEALHRLLAVKVEAHRAVSEHVRGFLPIDFAIPQIKDLLNLLGEEV